MNYMIAEFTKKRTLNGRVWDFREMLQWDSLDNKDNELRFIKSLRFNKKITYEISIENRVIYIQLV